jgi:hypothetical protein
VEQACASALRGLAVAGILFEVGLQAGSADALPMVRGITTTSEVKGGSTEIYPHLFGHLFQRLQALQSQDHLCFMDRSPRDRRSDRAMVVDDRDDCVTLVVLVARGANPIAPFFATVVVPSPWSTLRSSCCSTARCRTRATNAYQSDPSSAHLAKTL